jgi:hypothetical protein
MRQFWKALTGRLKTTPRPAGARRPQLEALEERQVPATFYVWNSGDSGPGTLRQAILDSNASPSQIGVNDIEFELTPGAVSFINLKSSLPVITAAVNINGYSQAGSHENTLANGDNAVILIGLYGEGAWTGLYIDASHVTVQGLGISHFKGDGIEVFGGADHTVIQGNYIGNNGRRHPGLFVQQRHRRRDRRGAPQRHHRQQGLGRRNRLQHRLRSPR